MSAVIAYTHYHFYIPTCMHKIGIKQFSVLWLLYSTGFPGLHIATKLSSPLRFGFLYFKNVLWATFKAKRYYVTKLNSAYISFE